MKNSFSIRSTVTFVVKDCMDQSLHTFLKSFSEIFLFKWCKCKLNSCWLKLHIGIFFNIPNKIFIYLILIKHFRSLDCTAKAAWFCPSVMSDSQMLLQTFIALMLMWVKHRWYETWGPSSCVEKQWSVVGNTEQCWKRSETVYSSEACTLVQAEGES